MWEEVVFISTILIWHHVAFDFQNNTSLHVVLSRRAQEALTFNYVCWGWFVGLVFGTLTRQEDVS